MDNIEKEIETLKQRLKDCLNDFKLVNKGISLDIVIKSIVRESPVAISPNRVLGFDIDIITTDWNQDPEYLDRLNKIKSKESINPQ